MNEFCFENIRMICGDNREFLAGLPDKSFDLAIDDPPYGIGVDGQKKSTSKHGGRKEYEFKGWDNQPPPKEYSKCLFVKTKNQIIWGANYFPQFLTPSMGWIFWDKGQRICNSDGELAFSSFDRALRVFECNRAEIQRHGGAIHPTQKPVALYSWLLQNYAKPGQSILDPHGGSFSSAIAAYRMGFSYVGIEKDPDYFAAAVERFKKEALQMRLFTLPTPKPQAQQAALIGI